MQIQLSDHFTLKKLLRFVLPPVVMMMFTSIYSVVDGFFVSNYAGETALAAINLVFPLIMALGAIGFMIGTGGSALVAKMLGEGNKEHANRVFSMLVYVSIGFGAALTAIGQAVIEPVTRLFGAEGELLSRGVLYARILLGTLTAFMLQNIFQSFFITAEKPRLGLVVTVAAGVLNIVLDALFVGVFGWKLVGAAAATAISQVVGGVLPLFYFMKKNNSLLRLTRAKIEWRLLGKTCANGSSELMTNISSSVVTMLFNAKLLALAGESGVAAYGCIMYVSFLFAAVFIGLSIGSAPVVSYHYGAQNRAELKSLLRKCLGIIGVLSVAMFGLAEGLSEPLSRLFVGYSQDLLDLTIRGFRLYSFAFLLIGINIFGSGFFTALNNGVVSAIISFLRTLLFQVAAILLLPIFLGIDGVWLAVVAAETLSLLVTGGFLIGERRRYGY